MSSAATPSQEDGSGVSPDQAPWPDRRLAWAALALLMAAMIVSQLDRMIINLVIEPVKAEFGLTDTQFGMLQGIAFGMFYTFMAFPLGMLADRYQRRIVVGIGVGLFSIFSISTGFARNYAQLFIARAGVGFGEASVAPAGFSIISDYFPPDRLGRAISLFTMSSFIGTAGAYMGGGLLIGWLDGVHAADPTILMGLDPWQLAFVLVALPGLILAPCFLLLREPVRRGLNPRHGQRLPFRVLLQELGIRRNFLILLLVGMAMVSTMSYATTIWAPAVFFRVHDWSPAQVGGWLGIIILITGTTGSYAAGWLVDKLTARGVLDAPLKVSGLSFLGCGTLGGLAPLMPTPELMLILLAPALFLKAVPFACAPIALQLVVPNQLRSQVSAIYLTFISLVGLLVGPIVVGFLTDSYFTEPADVRYSLALVVGATTPVMVIATLLAARPFRRLRTSGS